MKFKCCKEMACKRLFEKNLNSKCHRIPVLRVRPEVLLNPRNLLDPVMIYIIIHEGITITTGLH